jgi:hypothetical protein
MTEQRYSSCVVQNNTKKCQRIMQKIIEKGSKYWIVRVII